MQKQTQKLIFIGLLITLGIVLAQFLSIPIPPSQTTFKIGIGYLPLMLISLIYGPIYGLLSGIVQDLIGYFLWGAQQGPFHFGFVLNAILFGVLPWYMFKINLFKAKTYKIINLVFVYLFLVASIYLLFDIDLVTNRISNITDTFSYILVSASIFASMVIGGFLLWMKADDHNHHFVFIVAVMLVITSIILTPIWVYQLYNVPYWIQLPPRIVKLPFEIIIYSILLIRLYDLIKKLENRQFQ